jgi:hypothetical protein
LEIGATWSLSHRLSYNLVRAPNIRRGQVQRATGNRMARDASFVGTLIHLGALVVWLVAPPRVQPQVSPTIGPQTTVKYVGSRACQSCHADIYARWQKTPMANVVRDPREHPEAILPDLSTNTVAKFTKVDVALVYGSIWKQRYFTKIGDDYYPEPAQWDITAHVWRPYFVANGTDWWAALYPPDNMKRPTSATCDGCHSVNFNIQDHSVTEWNVGCERCHGPGSEHAAHPTRANVLNPTRQDYVRANDTCIQCHSQGRPLTNPIGGKYYDWPVGYHAGLNLAEYWPRA